MTMTTIVPTDQARELFGHGVSSGYLRLGGSVPGKLAEAAKFMPYKADPRAPAPSLDVAPIGAASGGEPTGGASGSPTIGFHAQVPFIGAGDPPATPGTGGRDNPSDHAISGSGAPLATSLVATREIARLSGYTGDECSNCHSMQVRYNGTCKICEGCGTTTGCS